MSDTNSLVTRTADRFGVVPDKLLGTLKSTAFKQRQNDPEVTNEQMMALLIVAEQYKLNPFTREIFAFPDKNNGIVPVVGVDGWSRIINENPDLDGIEFVYSENIIQIDEDAKPCPDWIECVISRKGRSQPIRVREFLDEVYRPPYQGNGKNGPYKIKGAWQTHTKRQLRHKSLIQCSRVAFGFVGVYDEDEAARIKDMGTISVVGDNTGNTTLTNNVQPLISCEHLNPILTKLTDRAIATGAWNAAEEYAKNRYQGEELNYALNFLQEKEKANLELTSSNDAATDSTQESNVIDAEVVDAEEDSVASNQ